ncbi:alanine--tRNA ligase [Proteiniborus sp. MB09-C3]|uniref:alanine--tRNA ligase n=1 Tax=Proteiniborus sp. MB09-C3 TaxID=3050072 RepID=UPI0025536D88|nr:alanine--tRNA ligase [Proteiniborus sp. MB09-C3]WIV11190.1 alanine--tRNA ligase [Proteiniborus sp. MB09-C3]
MKKTELNEIRKEFLDFFNEKGHLVAPSFSLVPKNDKSLLLINAGMAPLKAYFTGAQEPPRRRMATCQKCFRTNDIENVGKTARHGTFFEMLGNFSFGDYFKKEAIEWAWEFMTERMEIPVEKLWVSVYEEDDEAYEIWNKYIGIKSDRIVKLGKEDNFWELEVGPCGPCSEIYVDRGEKYGCGSERCKPGCDCDRYVEVWNLVFSQFDKDEEGNYNLVPHPNIDTGMGLERIAAVMQNAENIFSTDVMKILLKKVEEKSGATYGENEKKDMSIRVITDHIRAVTFLVSDGVLPSNEGRGYVLRRLIRRAARHGKLLGIETDFLNTLVPTVVELWGEAYPDLIERLPQVQKILKVEEEKFQETIDQGINILNEYIENMSNNNEKVLNGGFAFKLYDTYGFPLDLTKEILEEHNLSVDEIEFNSEMEKQRERARKAREAGDNQAWSKDSPLSIDSTIRTDFVGYTETALSSKIIAVLKDENEVQILNSNEKGIILLDKTPFYPEGGGQVGDTGLLRGNEFVAKVNDTKKNGSGQILHFVEVIEGTLKGGAEVCAEIDKSERLSTARNHSVTHLLHKALKEVLGNHVNQAGSLVMPDRLRFDFTHFEALKKEEIDRIEEIVNDKIFEGLDVRIVETSLEDARNQGAAALFDEKYGDVVRLVKIGDYSKELCGGTHISNSSQIGIFKIVSESGIASGVRRIEAITGKKAYEQFVEMDMQILKMADILKTNRRDIISRVQQITDDTKHLEKEVEKLKSDLAMSKLDDIINESFEVNGVKVISKRIDGMDMNSLRQLGDKARDSINSVVIVFGSVLEDKVSFIAMATKDLVGRGIHAGNIIREVAKMAGGGGGGRPDMAQAGGKDPSKIDEALSIVKDVVLSQLK